MENRMDRTFFYRVTCAVSACCLAAHADMITVDANGFGDFQTIQEAIDAAEDGDQVLVLPGVYTASDPSSDAVFDLRGRNITVDSFAGPETCIVDAEFSRRGVLCSGGAPETARISGLTIRNGATLLQDGAGMRIQSSDLTVQNCWFINNTALGSGGAIHVKNASPTFRDCSFTSNNAVNGGAISALKNGSDADSQMTVTLETCTFTDNEATTQGSGIKATGLDLLSAIDVTMSGSISNQSDFIASCSTNLTSISDSTFTTTGWAECVPDRSNSFSVIALEDGTGLVSDCTFESLSTPGCAIRATNSDLELELATFIEHGSMGCETSSVIDAHDSNLTLAWCYWDLCDGTLLAASGEGSLSVQNSEFVSVQSPSATFSSGFGIVSGAAISLQISDCTFSGLMRGVYCHDHEGLSISGSTFQSNGFEQGYTPPNLNTFHLEVQGNAMKDSIEILDCVFDGGQVWTPESFQGSASYSGVTMRNAGTTTITRCVFSNNSGVGKGSAFGGALGIYTDDHEDTPTSITDCTFYSNGGGEGALFGGGASALLLGHGPSTVRNTVFQSNRAWAIGAVRATADFANCLFMSNLASIEGIGTAHIDGSMTDCTIVNSNSDCGFGALMLTNCALDRVTILQGSASNDWKALIDCCIWNDDQLGGCIHIPDGSRSKDNCGSNIAETVSIRNSMICNGTPTEIYGVYEDLGQNLVASVCCQADITHDGTVDGADLAALLAAWGEPCLGCQVDLDFDGEVTGADLAVLLAQWNECGPLLNTD